MTYNERFSKLIFGSLLIASLFLPCGRWIVMAVGILFLASSAYGFCWRCKCKEGVFKKCDKK